MINSKIQQFILTNFLFTDDVHALPPDQSLISAGTLDSTGILELIAFVEDQFRISVADEEMVPENFDSVDAIAAFVNRKREAA